MRNALPILHQSATELKHRLKAERHPAKRHRLQALYLLASHQATSRQEVAALLGISRNTVGRWLTIYAEGGLDALLAVYIPAGKAPPLTPDQLRQLQAALDHPAGWESYEAIRTWINTTFALSLSYTVVYKLVHDKLGARPKVPRPRHPKKTWMP